jgi:hypothetical protein
VIGKLSGERLRQVVIADDEKNVFRTRHWE